ncbi:MAG: hypothetical protein EOP04_07615 [Proteobacteria bacterium]|nr:MAG: hypothetical protein EOP04_07615 [Pseudomonadota bacterium]
MKALEVFDRDASPRNVAIVVRRVNAQFREIKRFSVENFKDIFTKFRIPLKYFFVFFGMFLNCFLVTRIMLKVLREYLNVSKEIYVLWISLDVIAAIFLMTKVTKPSESLGTAFRFLWISFLASVLLADIAI